MSDRPRHPLSDEPTPDVVREVVLPRAFIVPTRDNAPLMWLLIAVNVGIFLLMQLDEEVWLNFFFSGALFPKLVFESNHYYRLFSTMFLHSSLAHLALNMLALYHLGSQSERLMGTTRFALIYFLGGLLGSVLSVSIGNYAVPSVGASGAIFAVWGGILWVTYRYRRLLGDSVRTSLLTSGFLLIGNLLIGFIEPRIDNWGHIGGLIGGVALAILIAPRYRERLVRVHPTQPPITIGEDSYAFTRARWGVVLVYVAGVLVVFWLGLFVFRLQSL